MNELYNLIVKANKKFEFPFVLKGYPNSHSFEVNQGVVLLLVDDFVIDDPTTIKSVLFTSLLHWLFLIDNTNHDNFSISIKQYKWQTALVSLRCLSNSKVESQVSIENNILEAFTKLLE